jgi:predicted Na+-dependent transporter
VPERDPFGNPKDERGAEPVRPRRAVRVSSADPRFACACLVAGVAVSLALGVPLGSALFTGAALGAVPIVLVSLWESWSSRRR